MNPPAGREQTLGDLAGLSGAVLRGDANRIVSQMVALEQAGPSAITFLANPRYKRHLTETRAAAVILAPQDADDCPVDCLIGDNPDLIRARVMSALYPPADPVAGVHPTATVGADVGIDPSSEVGAGCVLGDRVTVGAGVIIGPNCVLLDDVVIGAGTYLVASVTLGPRTQLGQRCIIHPGAVIGGDGFGMANDRGAWIKVPQIGRTVLGDDVEVGSCSSIDRGAIGDTWIADGVKIDSQVHVAHNVRIGRHTAMAGCAAVAGSTEIGERCTLAGAAGIVGHVKLADDVHISAATSVTRSITEPGVYTGIVPATSHALWAKNFARLRHLDDMVRRLKDMEQELAALKGRASPAD